METELFGLIVRLLLPIGGLPYAIAVWRGMTGNPQRLCVRAQL
jgi:hypothetical protein